MSCACRVHIMLLSPDDSLIANCSGLFFVCNWCDIDSYKAVTVITFSEHRRNRVAIHTHRNSICLFIANNSASRSLLESFHKQENIINLLSKAYQT